MRFIVQMDGVTNSEQMPNNTSALYITPNQSLKKLLPWFMWGCGALFYFFQFILRVSPSVMTTEMIEYFQVDEFILGTLTSAYYYGYSFSQIPVGISLDKLGPRRPLIFACLLCTIGASTFILTHDIFLCTIGRFLIGVGSAFGLITCIKIANLWFDHAKLMLVISLTIFLGTTGGAFGGGPLSRIIDAFGYNSTFYLFIFIASFLAFASWVIVKDKNPSQDPENDEIERNLIESIKCLIKNPQTWFIGLFGSLSYIPLSGFCDLWGPPFLMNVFGVHKQVASDAVSMFYIGVGIGCPLTAICTDFLKSHTFLMRYGALVTLTFFAILIYYPSLPFSLVYPLLFSAGFFSSTQFIAFVCTVTLNPKNMSATSSAFHNMLCMISGIVYQPLMGLLLKLFWDGSTISGKAIYTPLDYQVAMSLLPICLIGSFAITHLIRDTYSLHREIVAT